MMETFDYVIVARAPWMRAREPAEPEDAAQHLCARSRTQRLASLHHLPAASIKTFHMKSINWLPAGARSVDRGRSIYAPRGKTLGGSSRSTGTSTTGQRQISTLAHLGIAWGIRDVLPYFKRWSGGRRGRGTAVCGVTAI